MCSFIWVIGLCPHQEIYKKKLAFAIPSGLSAPRNALVYTSLLGCNNGLKFYDPILWPWKRRLKPRYYCTWKVKNEQCVVSVNVPSIWVPTSSRVSAQEINKWISTMNCQVLLSQIYLSFFLSLQNMELGWWLSRGKWTKKTNSAPGTGRAAGSDSQGAKRVERLGEKTELKVPRKSSNKVLS